MLLLLALLNALGANATSVWETLGMLEQNCSALLSVPVPQRTQQEGHTTSGVDSLDCPPWFHVNTTTGACQAGPPLNGIIQQNEKTLQTLLLQCNCMTEADGILTVGSCLYTCNTIIGYFPLPCQISDLNNFTCAALNRGGKLCGQCSPGHALPVYSYELECVECNNYHYNWLKYIAAAFLPLTGFYVIVTLFSISFTGPLLSGVVLTYQMLVNPIQMVVFVNILNSGDFFMNRTVMKLFATIVGIWNLDFLRLVYTPFCLHPEISIMQVMALDYAIAIFPLFLIFITYIMVKLHDHGFRPVVWAWKPLRRLLRLFKRQWNVRTSLIDAFASFIFLSNSRLLSASANFLVPTYVYTFPQNASTQPVMKHYLLNAPTVEYFSWSHLPFAILALVVLLLLVILPMLLLFVYPFQWFQHLLNKLHLNSHALRTFMEVFQGSFKNGTDGTKDYRYFSGFLVLMEIILFTTFTLTLSAFYYPIFSIFIVLYCTLFVVFQPYKKWIHNFITIAMATSFLITYQGIMINLQEYTKLLSSNVRHIQDLHKPKLLFSIVLMYAGLVAPLLYLLIVGSVLIYKRVIMTRNNRCVLHYSKKLKPFGK